MRFTRRRRRTRVQWMPVPGTSLLQNAGTLPATLENPSPFEFIMGTTSGAPVTVSVPLVVDNPLSATLGSAALSVYQQFALNQSNEFGWRLRRIVGDFFVGAVRQNPQSATPPGVLVEAGIIVRRVDRQGQPEVSANEQDVGALQNESDPWVWRRSWLLSDNTPLPTASAEVLHIVNQFPTTNVAYGTKHHIAIDQKTARRLGPEERLFMTVTAWEVPLNQTETGSDSFDDHLSVYFICPYRILGTVLTSAGNRRNASR